MKVEMKRICKNISIFLNNSWWVSDSWQASDGSRFKISFSDFYILLSLLKRVPVCFPPMDHNDCDQGS